MWANTLKRWRNNTATKSILAACGILLMNQAWALDLGGLPPEDVAVFVQNMDNGRIVVEHRADVAMNPASTMKLLTAWHALNRLGSDYRIRTYWHSGAKIENGVLEGDLVWRGSGDPSLDAPALQAMMQQLQQQGIRHIQGQLVLDKSLWQSIPSAERFENDSDAAFTVDPDTHMLDFHVLWLEMVNDGIERWKVYPPMANLTVDDALLTWSASGKCSSLKNRIQTQWQVDVLKLKGRADTACAGQKMYSKGVVGDEYVFRAFAGMWQQLGGTGVESYRSSHTPIKAGRILAKHESQPLAGIVENMNKYSNNVIARSLVLLAQNKAAVRADEALQGLRQHLQDEGIDTASLVLENGSGLSRRERLSARLLGQVLNKAYHDESKTAFWNSLPIAGVDGTLRKRFKPLQGQLFLKTGTLDDVRALAGYGVDAQGQTLAIVAIVNGRSSAQGIQKLDELVSKIMLMTH